MFEFITRASLKCTHHEPVGAGFTPVPTCMNRHKRYDNRMKRTLPLFLLSFLASNIALAAGDTPAFFVELAALFVSSAVIAYIGFRMGLTPIISFLLAGVMIGPNALGLVQDLAMIDAAAEVGVILLLFTIGIEFSLETLARISRLIFMGGGLQVGLTIGVSSGALMLFGVPWQAAVFTGMLLSLSSTAIIMKLLADRNETSSEPGQASLAILIFQDLAVVAMVLIVPLLGGEGGGTLSILWALTKAALIIVAVLLVARQLMPKVLEAVARTCSPEIFLLTVIAICFGTAYLTSLAGVSLSLGAFLAGLMVSESRFGQQAFSEILPLQILFSAAFFISVGILLDLQFLFTNLPAVLLGIVAVVTLKSLITFVSVRVLGYSAGVAAASALTLAQIGEFSFVLERAGREVGLAPLGLSEDGAQTFIACSVLLMGITPFMATFGKRFNTANTSPTEDAEASDSPKDVEERFMALSNHIIIAGYGDTARALAGALDDAGLPYGIATLSPTGATEAETDGRLVVRGDYTKGHILDVLGLERARLLVVPDDQPAMAHRTVSVARARQPALRILAATTYESAAADLKEAGANEVISAEHAATKLVVWEILNQLGKSHDEVQAILERLMVKATRRKVETMQLSNTQSTTQKCSHTDQAKEINAPSEHVCPECVTLGDSWVHLRICMTCGHVGCCDSSKNKHATAHFHSVGHPIIKSFEPGEDWAYCYEDKTSF